MIVGDVRHQQALTQVLLETKAVAVLHIGLSDVGDSVRDPLPYYDVNIGGALALAGAIATTNIDALIFSSTCAVYGPPEVIPIAGSAPLAPINPYGVSKMSAERIFADAGAACGIRKMTLRYFNAAGADPEGEIGERHDPETHLIPLALRAALPGDSTLKVVGEDYPTPDGTAIRDHIHVMYLADANVLTLRKL